MYLQESYTGIIWRKGLKEKATWLISAKMDFLLTKGEGMLWGMHELLSYCSMWGDYYVYYAHRTYHSNLTPMTVEFSYCKYIYYTNCVYLASMIAMSSSALWNTLSLLNTFHVRLCWSNVFYTLTPHGGTDCVHGGQMMLHLWYHAINKAILYWCNHKLILFPL